MMTVVAISLGIFACYMAVIMIVCHKATGSIIPPSISENFYLLESLHKGLGWLFFGWCTVIGISVMAVMFGLSEGQWYQFLPLFAGFGLVLVGCAPRFRSEERRMHQIGAFLCAVTAVMWCVCTGYWAVMLSSLGLAFAVSLFDWDRRIFWWEVGIFVSTYIIMCIEA